MRWRGLISSAFDLQGRDDLLAGKARHAAAFQSRWREPPLCAVLPWLQESRIFQYMECRRLKAFLEKPPVRFEGCRVVPREVLNDLVHHAFEQRELDRE